ncbi:uncharacterized protein LOC131021243 [Salvia miltiorrhiza]|uniref:uncharacterized protein LOC131021243 n=1 Tax=Salvia miltiorrhiza TaxID=226208 RepID=UPI0025AD3632|nr:uncharacterized protein LOC131021243 [Salvia miltiorrhiza]
MDAKEKVIALQKAYADIILNISKEAAARVMSSERRAMLYQHELKGAKEEALRMLLHLKKMMDARTSEAEAAALNQQKKIEELEAQLQEAEDIVRDLREELGEVQAELERLKKSNLQNVNEPDNDSSREVPTTIYSYESSKFHHPNSRDESAVASEITMSNPSPQSECSKCYYGKNNCMCSSHIRNQNLPSIVLRDNYKEPGLYRNGCTQRIHACERNLLDKELCLPGETDSLKDKNISEEREKGGYTIKAPSFGATTRSELENKLLADVKLSSFQPFRRKRKRATKQRETVTCLTKKLSDPLQKPDQLPELSSRHILASVKDDVHSSESPSTVAPILSPVEVEKKWIGQGCEGLKEKMVPLGEETGFAESDLPPVCKGAVEKDDMPSNSLDWTLSDTTKGLPSQPTRERIIKYTFQRKRKRGAPSESEMTVSPEMEKRNEDSKSAHKNQKPSKASLLSESSRDSRRLAQVARQLISLSEKKWWH